MLRSGSLRLPLHLGGLKLAGSHYADIHATQGKARVPPIPVALAPRIAAAGGTTSCFFLRVTSMSKLSLPPAENATTRRPSSCTRTCISFAPILLLPPVECGLRQFSVAGPSPGKDRRLEWLHTAVHLGIRWQRPESLLVLRRYAVLLRFVIPLHGTFFPACRPPLISKAASCSVTVRLHVLGHCRQRLTPIKLFPVELRNEDTSHQTVFIFLRR